ncbi:MAG: hypothetical protein PHI10_05050 [Dehalococcoidales bacterium]|nr:hypothetical protein [Dehalococcoidales bacterium]
MKISEIISLQGAGALAALAILILKSPVENPAVSSLIYISCIAYILIYCYTSYRDYYDPLMQAKQEAMIKETQAKIMKRFRK